MNTYTVAFSGPRFLMVFNPARNGWEMPGGKIEEGEEADDAAVREFAEESGYEITLTGRKEMSGCYVFAAVLGKRIRSGEMRSSLFHELPDDLAFARSEYDGVTEWARSLSIR